MAAVVDAASVLDVAANTADVTDVGSAVVLSAVVLSAVVVVDAPVPTTCLLGMMPSGIRSALMVAKLPKAKRASITARRLGI